MIQKLYKEVCEPCHKFINIEQPLLECDTCSIAIHTKCYKTAKFRNENGLWVCNQCFDSMASRYNPYLNIASQDSDKFYDDCDTDPNESIQAIARLLNACRSYTASEVGQLLRNCGAEQNPPSDHKPKNKNHASFSSYFLNLDGNLTNFDGFSCELKRTGHNFSVIGLAETNTRSDLGNLYKLPFYNSYYQDMQVDKKKGSGVAIYVHETLNANVVEDLSHCDPDIESIFVKISNTADTKPLLAGVIYRPPNGNFDNFIQNLERICSEISNFNSRIMGDFNADLLKTKENQRQAAAFEDCFLKNGFAPTISIPTHERIHCQSSCIDNILTNQIESAVISGTISEKIGDHLPIFEMTNIPVIQNKQSEKRMIFHDYSNANLNKFVQELTMKIPHLEISDKFSDFTELFGNTLDAACKLDQPKVSKRTVLNNPWITESLVNCINRKHELKEAWIKSKTRSNPDGDGDLHTNFINYRRILKHAINNARKSYFCSRINDSKEDRKKTWQIINELRGKSKRCMKPSFVIDNKKVTDRRVIANAFNKYFNSIASQLSDSLIDHLSP